MRKVSGASMVKTTLYNRLGEAHGTPLAAELRTSKLVSGVLDRECLNVMLAKNDIRTQEAGVGLRLKVLFVFVRRHNVRF
jgi:hypothetical protein